MRPGRSAAMLCACAALALAGCARSGAAPPIRRGAACAACGMEIESLRFACERRAGREWRVYDSIECLLRDGGPRAASQAWLADYDSAALHSADSLWVVQGSFPSPMGGGYAAFLSRAAADSLAAQARGTVARLAARVEHS